MDQLAGRTALVTGGGQGIGLSIGQALADEGVDVVRGDSYIVNTASGAGLAFTNSGAVYHTTKYAVVGLSEAMHAELGPLGIGVSVLCPGPVATNIIDNT